MTQKLQDIKDAARAQEPVARPMFRKPIVASTEDRQSIEGKTPTSTEEPNSNSPQFWKGDDDTKSVAGRKTMLKSGETKELHQGKEALKGLEREKEKYPVGKKVEQEKETESKEDHEVEMELNSILKKGPSKYKSIPSRITRRDCSG